MSKLVIALVIAVAVGGPVVASQETDVMAPVRQFVDAFNKGDTKMVQAACADETFIIDDFPPHEWHGAGATSKWFHGYDAYAKRNGITDGIITLGKPRHIDITAGHAYVVVPANLTLKKQGKLVKETGSMTLALHKGANGWQITAWAWAEN